jgi:hypothetical protein
MDFRSPLLQNFVQVMPPTERAAVFAGEDHFQKEDEHMRIRPAGLTNLYRFPTGRRLHALREIARRAMELVVAPAVTHATRAIAHDQKVMAMEAAMAAANTSQHGPGAAVLDRKVDRAITGLELHLDAQVRMYGEEHSIGRDATLVRDELLPDGAGAITFLPYATQHERIDALLAIVEDPAGAIGQAVTRVPGLSQMFTQLRTLNDDYGTSLHGYDRSRPTREELAEAQAEGQDNLAEVVFVIMAHYAGQPELRAQRDSLLEPVLRQNEAIRLARRRRRLPGDVDPEAGIELPEPGTEQPDDGNEIPAPDPGAAGTRAS